MENKEIDRARQAQNAYMREYRAKNKARIKEINNRYWTGKAKQQEEPENDSKTV